MSNLSVFAFNSNAVRVLTIEGEPWFLAKDLCEILDIRNPSQALARLDDDEKNTIILNEGIPGNPEKSIVSESGMYALVLSSRKSEAKRFRKWVTSEVLPAIRKTGSYTVSQSEPEQASASDYELEALKLMDGSQCRMFDQAIEVKLKAKLAEILFAEESESSEPASDREKLEMQWQDVFIYVPKEIGSRLGISAHQANLLLLDIGFQVRNTNKKSEDEPDYIPTELGQEYGAWDGSVPEIKWSKATVDVLRTRVIELGIHEPKNQTKSTRTRNRPA